MARIRSVHPSLFTDEAWVSCSPLARILYIGLLCDADDQGLFEWKTLQIKMRLLPGDAADVSVLLAELVAVDLIAQLEAGGKKLGAIRYFRRFQRPKKPNAVFVLPERWRAYVGLGAAGVGPVPDDEEPVPDQFPTSTESPPQMEDGGGRVEEVEDADASLSDHDPTAAPEEPQSEEPKRVVVRVAPSKADLDAIWEITPKLGRERSSRKDLERSLTAAMRRGHNPADVRSGLVAAYASPSFSGDHAKGVHRLIENDRWQSFTEEIAGTVQSMDPAREAEIRRRMIELAESRAANA